MKTLFILHCEI